MKRATLLCLTLGCALLPTAPVPSHAGLPGDLGYTLVVFRTANPPRDALHIQLAWDKDAAVEAELGIATIGTEVLVLACFERTDTHLFASFSEPDPSGSKLYFVNVHDPGITQTPVVGFSRTPGRGPCDVGAEPKQQEGFAVLFNPKEY